MTVNIPPYIAQWVVISQFNYFAILRETSDVCRPKTRLAEYWCRTARHAPLNTAQLAEGRDDQTNRREHEHESTTDKRFSLHDLTHDENPHELFINEIQRIF